MEKPPVLTERQFEDWCKAHQKQVWDRFEAQRDADSLYYEQARQDTAREIFEEIEQIFGWLTLDGYGKKHLEKIIVDDVGYYGEEGSLSKWESLKAKYIK
jgi:hypothetical protein